MLVFPILAFTTACAPRYSPAPLPAPSPVATVLLAGGPEGESSVASLHGTAVPVAEKRPALVTAVMIPTGRMAAAFERLRRKNLVIPVAGVGPSKIEDSFSAGRDGGERQHHAVDILAPRNTPVVAADDGTILRMSTNSLGGITIYAADRDREFVYYYAHLDHYRKGVTAGHKIRKGDTLGFVGTSGNAPENVPHLHFQIMLWPADGKYWNGEPVNPYPVLRSVTGSGGDRPRFD